MERLKNWIEIDGVASKCFGLHMDRLPLWPAASETVENIVLPGVPIEIDRHTGQYRDIDLTLRGYLTKPPYRIPDIMAWLHNGKKLMMSTQPTVYGIIRTVGQIAPVRIGTRANEISIPITCKPFKYRLQNFSIVLDTSPAHYHIFGNVYAEPLIELDVDAESLGAAILWVNDVALQIQTPALDTGHIVIDVERRKIYKVASDGTKTIIQAHTSGQFWRMVLYPGENEIRWNFGITRVTLTPNERWL